MTAIFIMLVISVAAGIITTLGIVRKGIIIIMHMGSSKLFLIRPAVFKSTRLRLLTCPTVYRGLT